MSAVDYYNGVIISSSQGSTILSFSGTITAGGFSAIITHNLGVTPTSYFVTPTNDYAALGGIQVTAITATTATISITNAQGADATFKLGVSA